MFRGLQPRVGFGWAVRAIAFVNLLFALMTVLIIGQHKGRRQQPRSVIDLSALRETPYMLLTLGIFFIDMAYYIPLFYVVSYARYTLHASEDFAFNLLVITNAGSFFGRTIPYMLGRRVKPIHVLLLASCIGSILMFSWIRIRSLPGFAVFCALWGFVSGILVTAPTATIPHPVMAPSMRTIGTRMGMALAAGAVGSLIGAPIAGALSNATSGNFLHAQIFGGIAITVGAACFAWPLVAIERHDKAQAAHYTE